MLLSKQKITAFIVFLVSFVTLAGPLFFSSYNSNKFWNVNSYDGISVMTVLKNNLKDGVFKNYGFGNRKGHMYVDYYLPAQDGCLLISHNPAPKIYTVFGQETPSTTLVNDCIYAHYPPLVDWIYLSLAKLGLVSPDNFKSIGLFVCFVNALSLAVLCLLLTKVFFNPILSMVTILGLLLTPAILMNSYDIYYRPFELLFFMLQLYFWKSRNAKGVLLFGVLGGMSGFDLLLPNIFLILNGRNFISRKTSIIALLIMILPQVLLRYYFYKDHAGILSETMQVLADRFNAGTSYGNALVGYFRSLLYFSGRFIIDPFLFGCCLVVILLQLKSISLGFLRNSRYLIFSLLSVIWLAFFLPRTSEQHAWYKYQTAILPIAFLYCWFAQILLRRFRQISTWKKCVLSVSILSFVILGNWRVYARSFDIFSQRFDIERLAYRSNMNLVDSIVIYSDRAMDWKIADKEKSLMLPTLGYDDKFEYVFSWPHSISRMANEGPTYFNLYLRSNAVPKSLELIYFGESLLEKCKLNSYTEAAVQPQQLEFHETVGTIDFETNGSRARSLKLNFDLPARTTILQLQCPQGPSSLIRIWPN